MSLLPPDTQNLVQLTQNALTKYFPQEAGVSIKAFLIENPVQALEPWSIRVEKISVPEITLVARYHIWQRHGPDEVIRAMRDDMKMHLDNSDDTSPIFLAYDMELNSKASLNPEQLPGIIALVIQEII